MTFHSGPGCGRDLPVAAGPGARRSGRACRIEPESLAFLGGAGRETVLGPGDGLYIPARHWHYVRALSPSISVNFWWR